MTNISALIDFHDSHLRNSVILIILCPLIWNLLARTEYKTRFLTKLCGGNKYLACYVLTVWIFSFSCFRDYHFHLTLSSQPVITVLHTNVLVGLIAIVLIAIGQLFVLSSFYRLGITGTFLGDYCGILMDAPVTGFPFSVLDNPMYTGSSMTFVGYSLLHGSVGGLFLSVIVSIVYQIALLFEGPFTTQIYQDRKVE